LAADPLVPATARAELDRRFRTFSEQAADSLTTTEKAAVAETMASVAI
jgi:hypothetical protein